MIALFYPNQDKFLKLEDTSDNKLKKKCAKNWRKNTSGELQERMVVQLLKTLPPSPRYGLVGKSRPNLETFEGDFSEIKP